MHTCRTLPVHAILNEYIIITILQKISTFYKIMYIQRLHKLCSFAQDIQYSQYTYICVYKYLQCIIGKMHIRLYLDPLLHSIISIIERVYKYMYMYSVKSPDCYITALHVKRILRTCTHYLVIGSVVIGNEICYEKHFQVGDGTPHLTVDFKNLQ